MGPQLTTLSSSDRQRFENDGYVVVRQAFSRADGHAMERRWWSELEDTHNIRPDDRPSWRQIRGDLKAAPGARPPPTLPLLVEGDGADTAHDDAAQAGPAGERSPLPHGLVGAFGQQIGRLAGGRHGRAADQLTAQ